MAEYLSKVLHASLKAIATKGILNAGVPAGHIITLKERGYIETGPVGVGNLVGWVVSDKGKQYLDSH